MKRYSLHVDRQEPGPTQISLVLRVTIHGSRLSWMNSSASRTSFALPMITGTR